MKTTAGLSDAQVRESSSDTVTVAEFLAEQRTIYVPTAKDGKVVEAWLPVSLTQRTQTAMKSGSAVRPGAERGVQAVVQTAGAALDKETTDDTATDDDDAARAHGRPRRREHSADATPVRPGGQRRPDPCLHPPFP